MRSKVRNNVDILSGFKIDVPQFYYLFVANIAPGCNWVSYFYCISIPDSVLIPALAFRYVPHFTRCFSPSKLGRY